MTSNALERATTTLLEIGFQVRGITFDFEFNQVGGLAGIALLKDGRQLRFWLPDDATQHPVISVLAGPGKN